MLEIFLGVEFYWSVSQLKKGKENRCLVFTISMKREIKKFSRRCRAVTAKKSCCKFCLSRVSVFV